jgi:hypothetical protein
MKVAEEQAPNDGRLPTIATRDRAVEAQTKLIALMGLQRLDAMYSANR